MSSLEGLEVGYRFAGSGETVLAYHSREDDDVVLVAPLRHGDRYCVFNHREIARHRAYFVYLEAARAEFIDRLRLRGVPAVIAGAPSLRQLAVLSLFAAHPVEGQAVLRGAAAMEEEHGPRWFDRARTDQLTTRCVATQLDPATPNWHRFTSTDEFGMSRDPRSRMIAVPLWRVLIEGLREVPPTTNEGATVAGTETPTQQEIENMSAAELRRHVAERTMAYNGGCTEGKREFLRSIGLGADIPLGRVRGGVVTLTVDLALEGGSLPLDVASFRADVERSLGEHGVNPYRLTVSHHRE